jgi:hypothetical protein
VSDRKKTPALAARTSREAMALTPATAHVAASVKALHAGTASPHQQQTALNWIVSEAGGKAFFPYQPDPHDTAFALGRLFVADAIVGLINADLSTLRRAEHVETSSRSS